MSTENINQSKIFPKLWLLFLLIIVTSFHATKSWSADDSTHSALWDALRNGGHIGLLRHALAPGTSDPDNFVVDNCSTQRNLSTEGRKQAQLIGTRLRKNGIAEARIYSSQWCRCLDTAELLNLGPVKELSIINSFYQRWERRDEQTQALQQWLINQTLDNTPIILVSHQVNISALTNTYASSGELVIIRLNDNDSVEVIGTIETD